MKLMKRFSIFIMLAVLVLAGCSKDQTSSKGKDVADKSIELKYWVPFSGSDGEFMEGMVKKFNESQDEIKVEFMNSNWQDYYPKLKTSLVSKSAPDIAVAHVSSLGDLIPTGMIQPIDDLVEDAGLDWSTYAENQVNAIQVNDEHFAIPLDTHAVIMYYNKKLLEEANLLDESGNIEMGNGVEGFANVLRTLKKELPEDVSPLVVGSNNIFTFWIWYALLNQQGENYIEDGKVLINSTASKNAMELIQTWLDEGLMPADIGDNSYDIFKTQKAAITFTGVWATGNFETEETLDFAAVPFPKLFDEPAAWGDSHTLIIPKQDDREKQVAAVKFADWLAENGAMWAEAGHIPSKPSVIESDQFKEMNHRSDYATVMEIVEYMPETPQLSAINDAILESLVKINYGQATVEEGLQEAQEKVEALLKK